MDTAVEIKMVNAHQRSYRATLLSSAMVAVVAGGMVFSPVAVSAAARSENPEALPKPSGVMFAKSCNPCSAQKGCGPCNPCKPRAAQKGNNPCAAVKDSCAPACVLHDGKWETKRGCNPCAAKKPSCNPCNPCATKKPSCNPCNPCAAKKPSCNPCNPCAAKKPGCNPCNPCAAKRGCGPCNPCTPCGPSDGSELSPAQAKAAYNCLKGEMIKGYAKSGLKTAKTYMDWLRVNTAPYQSSTHGARYVNNYVNAVGAEAYRKYENIDSAPVGTILAKDSFVAHANGSVSVGPLFLMEKKASGYAKTGGWKYTLIQPDGTVTGTTRGAGAKTVNFCAECHDAAAEDQDYLFFMPERVRK